jgi:hypothetical protein
MRIFSGIKDFKRVSGSNKNYFLEISGFVKACRIGISGLPGQIPDGLVGRVVHSEDVDHEPRLGLSSSNNVQSDLKPSIPAVCGQRGSVISRGALEELIAQG